MGDMTLALVIFDMDGTLLEPRLDFDAMRREMNLPDDVSVLEGMARLTETERARAEAILDRHEADAAARSALMPGAEALVTWLRERGVKVAVLTRNSRRSLEAALERHGLAVDASIARDEGAPKPSPEGVHRLMEDCGATAEKTVVVGDFRFDIQAGRAAGCRTVALVPHPPPDWAEAATWRAASLGGVREALATLVEGDG